MTVGELFVKLGFRVENKESFDRAVAQLGLAESKAINLKRGAIGLGAAFAGLMWFTTNAATNLFKFHLVTGLSTRALQDWQFAGARAGVAAAEIADVFKNLQQQQVAIQFGEGNLAPWALLGIDSRQDPMPVLWQIHERVKLTAGMGAAQARYLTTKLGLSEAMFQFLRRDDLERGQLEEKFKTAEETQKTFDELNGKLAQMKEKLELVAMQFGVTFGPKLIEFMERFTRAGGPLDKFTDWLQKLSANTAEGEKMRAFWIHVAEGIGIAAVALAALNIASKLFMTGAAIKILFGGAAAAVGTTVGEPGVPRPPPARRRPPEACSGRSPSRSRRWLVFSDFTNPSSGQRAEPIKRPSATAPLPAKPNSTRIR